MICAECAEEVEDGLTHCPACSGEPLLERRHRIDTTEQIDALGTSYRGTRVSDGTPVWLRELPFRGGSGDPGAALELEAERLAALEHPALPSWIEHFLRRRGRAGALWLVQAQVYGSSLARLARERVFDEPELLTRLELLADLLRHLHAQTPPIVHGSVTPTNVIESSVRDRGLESSANDPVRLQLVGFNAIGIDRQISAATGSGVQTLARAMASMAPEQFFGAAEPATDVWGLGLIAVVLLTGATPLELRDPDHRLLWRDRVSIDASLAELLDSMLERDPARRPSADELCQRLAALRRSQRPTVRLPRDEILRGADRPAAIAGSIGTRSPEARPRPPVVRETPRPVRRSRRSSSSDDIPVMRPADLSRELSQAFHVTERLLGRERRRLTAARMVFVLVVAVLTALAVWMGLGR